MPLAAHADDGTLANDANGYYDFIPADQLDASYAGDLQTDSATATVAPSDTSLPGGHGGGTPGGPPGGSGFPIPIPIPAPHNWACYTRDRAGHQYTGTSFDQMQARRRAMNICEKDSNAGHCRLIGCRRY